MPSVDELAARCHRIGGDLREQDLSLYELVDRATALTFIARILEQITEREYPVVGSGMNVDPVQQDINAAMIVLSDAAAAAQAGQRERLRDRLLTAQGHLLAICRSLTD
jgi:hypothetical protein